MVPIRRLCYYLTRSNDRQNIPLHWLHLTCPPTGERHDRFVVMEKCMADQLVTFGVEREKIVCLDIPDSYERGDSELVTMLEVKLSAML